MSIGKFRCIVLNVTDLERGERFWSAVFREKGTYPLGSPNPYLEWAVMLDPFGNKFCLIKDLV